MNKVEMVIAGLVIFGVLLNLLQFHPFHAWGTAIISILVAFFLADEIKLHAKEAINYLQGKDQFKTVLLGGLLLSVLISLPMLFLGLCIGLGVKSLLR